MPRISGLTLEAKENCILQHHSDVMGPVIEASVDELEK